MTTVIHIAIISKLSRGGGREKRFITACICFLKKKFFKKLSENPLTIKRF